MIVKGESIERNVSLKEIFFSFLKLGATAYGGPAMVANIKDMAVKDKGWLSEQEFLEGVALCQVIPGAIAFQAASYAGFKLRGIRGAIIAAFAFTFPAFLLMFILSSAYFRFGEIDFVEKIFMVLRAIVVGIIINATFNIGRSTINGWKGLVLSFLAFWLFFYKINILWVIFISAIFGILFYYSKNSLNKREAQILLERDGNKRRKLLLSGLTIIGFMLISFLFWTVSYISPVTSKLCFTLMKIDALAFGGGYTSLPLIQAEVVHRYGWLTTQEFIDGIAMGQITPGPVVITATFIGYKVYKIVGAILATIAMFIPSITILVFLSLQYERFKRFKFFQPMVNGILASFVGMLGMMIYHFGKEAVSDFKTLIIAITSAILIYCNVKLIYIIGGGVVVSLLFFKM